MGLNLNCSCQKHVFLYNFVVIYTHHFFTRVPYHDVSHGMTILWLLSSIIFSYLADLSNAGCRALA
jgi:hypothetical protein